MIVRASVQLDCGCYIAVQADPVHRAEDSVMVLHCQHGEACHEEVEATVKSLKQQVGYVGGREPVFP